MHDGFFDDARVRGAVARRVDDDGRSRAGRPGARRSRGAPRGGATGVGVEGSPGPEPRDGDAGERLRHVTIDRGAGGRGLAR